VIKYPGYYSEKEIKMYMIYQQPDQWLHQKQIDSNELKRVLEARKNGELSFLLVDVREPDEYEAGHIVGVDLLLPVSQFGRWAPTVQERYGDLPLILTCRTSTRTAQVQKRLEEMGMQKVVNHIGGIVSYPGDIATGLEGVEHV